MQNQSTPARNHNEDYEYLKSRGVEYLVHFTPAENVESILKKGLCPRSVLDAEGIEYAHTDDLRLEGTSVVNVSITNPNIEMFYKKRKESPERLFCVLLIDPAILSTSTPRSYTATNATGKDVQPCSVEEVFHDPRPDFFQSNWPTNNQAEVLLKDVIPPAYIQSIQLPARSKDDPAAKQIATQAKELGLTCAVEFRDQYFSWNEDVLSTVEAEETLRTINFDCLAVSHKRIARLTEQERSKLLKENGWSLTFLTGKNPEQRSNQMLSAFSVIEKIINRGRITILSEKLEGECENEEEIALAHMFQCTLVELAKHRAFPEEAKLTAIDENNRTRTHEICRAALYDLKQLSAAVCDLYECPRYFANNFYSYEIDETSYAIRFNGKADVSSGNEAQLNCVRPFTGSPKFDFTRVNESAKITFVENAVNFLLDYIFRFKSFREGQVDAIRRTLKRQDSIVLLPTGSGKSIIFQLISLITPGTAIVVCPIIALIEDQVVNLRAKGIDRVAGISSSTANKYLEGIATGQFILSYVSPERFQNRKFKDAIRKYCETNIMSAIAIDEAHCVSEWGHEFRPSYLGLANTCRKICATQASAPPLLALTGTASMSVLKDMKRDLGIDDDFAIIEPSTFDRPEIHYRVINVPSSKKMNSLEDIVRKSIPSDFGASYERFYEVTGQEDTNCGIVFCLNVNGGYGLKGILNHPGVHDRLEKILPGRCAFYSGKCPNSESKSGWEKKKQDQASLFKNNRCSVMAATSAFGMGIDKPNVRWIAHFGLPKSLEEYYQQAGRAARDRKDAYVYILMSDDYPGLNSAILDPSITRVENINEMERNKTTPDDVSRLMYFHTDSFSGVEQELEWAGNLLDACIGHEPHVVCFDSDDGKKAKEKAIYRFLLLGVFESYEIDYINSRFVIKRAPVRGKDLCSRIEESYLEYVKLYQSDKAYLSAAKTRFREAVSAAADDREHIMSAFEHLLREFTYKVLEEGKRRAALTMLSAARAAANAGSPAAADAEFRKHLLAYLSLDGQDGANTLRAIINRATEAKLLLDVISDYAKREDGPTTLLGQTSRLLEDYPQHYGLHYIQAAAYLLAGNTDAMNTALATAQTFGQNNYGLPESKRRGDWVALLQHPVLAEMDAEHLDALIPAFCSTFSIERSALLEEISTEQAQALAFVDRAFDLVRAIEQELPWISTK